MLLQSKSAHYFQGFLIKRNKMSAVENSQRQKYFNYRRFSLLKNEIHLVGS